MAASVARSLGLPVARLARPVSIQGVAGATTTTEAVDVPLVLGGTKLATKALVVEGLDYQVILGTQQLFGMGQRVRWESSGAMDLSIRLGDGPALQAVLGHAPRVDTTSRCALTVIRTATSIIIREHPVLPTEADMADADLVQAAVAALQVPDLRPGKPALERDAEDPRQDDREAWKQVVIDPSLPKKTRLSIARACARHWRCFTNRAVPPVAPGVVHHITLKPGADLSSARDQMRRLSPDKQQAVAELLEKLEAAGRLTSIPSLAAAVPVVVAKRNEAGETVGFRVAVDFRQLNQLSVVEAYPMPNLRRIIDNNSAFPRRSKCDARACFHAVSLDEESVPLTGTWFGEGRQFCWKVSPFGLASLPQTVQRAMDDTFRDVPNTDPYLDDIIQGHEEVEAIPQDIDRMLSALEKLGLCLSPAKCFFGFEELTLLGFKVGHRMVSMTEHRAKVIREWPMPRTPKEVRQFLGMAQTYVKHVPGFQAMAWALRPFAAHSPATFTQRWSTGESAAFNELRDALGRMVATAPMDNGELTLTTDYSATAVGWILDQVQSDGVRRIIDAGSMACNEYQRRYAPMDGEVFALATALRQLDYLGLKGRTIQWHTDNKPATTALFDNHRSQARVQRTAVFLTRYNIIPRHVKGSECVADALSRLKEMVPAGGKPEPEATADEVMYFTEVLATQAVADDAEPQEDASPVGEDTDPTWVPEADRKAVLQRLHGKVHHSSGSMVRDAKGRFSWAGITADAKRWTEACEICQRTVAFRDDKAIGRATASRERGAEWELDLMFHDGHTILTGREVATGFVVSRSLQSKEAKEVWNATQEAILIPYGKPKRLRLDMGSEWHGGLRSACKKANIEIRATPVGDNNAIGGVERAHGTMASYMRRLSMELGVSVPWTRVLAEATAHLNGHVVPGTTVSPYEAWTGQRWEDWQATASVEPRSSDTIEDLAAETKQAGEAAVESIQEARQQRNAQDARRRGRPAPLSVGDSVGYLPKARDRVKPAKVWLGPYRITHVHEGGQAYDLVAANVGPEASPEMVRASTFKKASHRFVTRWLAQSRSEAEQASADQAEQEHVEPVVDAPVELGQAEGIPSSGGGVEPQSPEQVAEQATRVLVAPKMARAQQKVRREHERRITAEQKAQERAAQAEAAARQSHATEEIRGVNVETYQEQVEANRELVKAEQNLQRIIKKGDESAVQMARRTVQLLRTKVARAKRALGRALASGERVRPKIQRIRLEPENDPQEIVGGSDSDSGDEE